MTDSTLHKALITIKKLKQRLQEKPAQNLEPIAIVGMSCRFPGADNVEEFWKLLSEGKNAITPIPAERWELLKNTNETAFRDESLSYWGGFLKNISDFDAYFFGITPREALRIDPQQRILLEVAYEALEDAGMSIENSAGSNTGVFSSLYASQFGHMQDIETDMDALYIPTGNAVSMAANRLSYLFDLQGPSIALDSACSSSLIAAHLACLHLQNNLCDTALVCGVNINLSPSIHSLLSKAKMLSPDGQCKTFDASANGYVQGEGAGAIVLKPLSKAQRDNDRIYAIIPGSAVNQDGKTNGLTAPNGLQQEKLLRTACSSANINPEEISYLECHGTGTFLGDPIELQAVGEAISKNRNESNPCWIGSVKTNIGHLEPAAGIASIIKVALSIAKKQIPPHLNFSTPNPNIHFEKYHLQVPTQLQPWSASRVAGVSGFGFGGTNAHLIIREFESDENITSENITQKEIFTLSAKEPEALKMLISQWCEFLTSNSHINLSQLCHTLHVRRSHFSFRLAIITDSVADLTKSLLKLKENFSADNQAIFISQHLSHRPAPESDFSDPVNVANSYTRFASFNWKKIEEHRNYKNMSLPHYAWQHKHYWPEMKKSPLPSSDHLFRGHTIASPLKQKQFEFIFDCNTIPAIKDTYHILHAGYYLEMLAFALNNIAKQTIFTVQEIIFSSPIIVPNSSIINVHLIFEEIDEKNFKFNFYSSVESKNNWIMSSSGQLTLQSQLPSQIKPIEPIKNKSHIQGSEETFYKKVHDMRMPSEGSIRWTHQYWLEEKSILCEFRSPQNSSIDRLKLNVHFGVVDACIQSLFLVLPDEMMKPFVASKMENLTYYGGDSDNLYLYSTLGSIDQQGYSGDWSLFNKDNQMVMHCEKLVMTQLSEKMQITDLTKEPSQSIDLSKIPSFQRKERVLQFLIEQTAQIFSMPKQDIMTTASLRDMGIDSLLALVLIRAIENAFQVTYSLASVLAGPTLNEISDTILSNVSNTMPQQRPWIAAREPKPKARFRLFCFPYGGGGASIYRHWQSELPDSIDVCAVQLPGREDRLDEKPIANINKLIDALIENLQSEFDLPFAFWGHSFGSLIGFEMTRQLRKRNLPMPIHLFVSAYPEPRLPTRSLDNLIFQLKDKGIDFLNLTSDVSHLTNQQLDDLLDVFHQNAVLEYKNQTMSYDVLKLLLPIFIADMSIVKSYRFTEEKPLDLPITVFMGTQDTFVLPEDILGWPLQTEQNCHIHKFNSGHLFLKEETVRHAILQKIVKELGEETELVLS